VVGVTWRKRGELHRARAGAEVLLAAGAINSPHLLQVSGIGPAAHLATIGVEVVHDLPGVGEGLQDHFATRVAHRVTRPVTLNERARPWRLGWEIATWLVGGNGLLAFSPAHVGAFLRSRPGLEQPDLQFVFTPASYNEGGVTGGLESLPGMTCGVWQLRPESRGHVRAHSADPMEAPAIQPNYLATETDRRRQSTASAGHAGCSRPRRWLHFGGKRRCLAILARVRKRCSPIPALGARRCTTLSEPAGWARTRLRR